MKNTITNKINSFNAAIDVADDKSFKPIWSGQDPLRFSEGLEEIRPLLAALTSKGARQSTSIMGGADALRVLRADYEKYLHRLARATFQALTRLGRAEDAAKVDFTPSDLSRCRALDLAGKGETLLELAEPLSAAPSAGSDANGKKEGITPAMTARVDDLWNQFSTAVGSPAGLRARRKALTNQLPRDVSDLEAKFAAADDFIIQFDDTELGREFVASWFNARKVVDLGRRSAKPASPAQPVAS